MRHLFSILVLCFLTGPLSAQTDIPNSRKIRIEAKPEKGLSPNASNGLSLRMPSVLGESPNLNMRDSLYRNPVQMLPDKELKQAGHDLVIKPKMSEGMQGNSGKHFGDMYLGDIKTKAKFVGIVCRDHEFVDGDRVRIYANDEVVEYNILLTGAFKGINLELDKGFNRLDFEALNQGSTGPNTAQVDVYDEKGQLLYSNKWLLSTGSKASLIIVKED
ncbi:MAG: hypothetical protein P8Z38_00545 [Robiginitalea sp.]|jgi:hypothetical protein